MNKMLHIALLILLPLAGCYKDDVNVDALNNNPFDPGYVGPPVFMLVGTYTQVVNIGGGNVLYQIIEFRVREELFLSPASYSVQLNDLQAGSGPQQLNPDPVGGSTFKYYRQPLQGQAICLELRLSNNLNTAGAEIICATL